MTIDLFLIGGQSNAAGAAGNSAGSPDVALFESVMWSPSDDCLTPTDDPISGVGSGSAWPAFANQWFASTGRRCILVQAASSGSAQAEEAALSAGHHWDEGGEDYQNAIIKFDNALKYLSARKIDYAVRGILWHQGERDSQSIDASNSTVAQYRTSLENMMARFRGKYGQSFEMWMFRVGRPNSADTSGFSAIRAEQDDAASTLDYINMVYTNCVNFSGLGWMVDELHYTQTGYNDMGQSGAVAIAGLI